MLGSSLSTKRPFFFVLAVPVLRHFVFFSIRCSRMTFLPAAFGETLPVTLRTSWSATAVSELIEAFTVNGEAARAATSAPAAGTVAARDSGIAATTNAARVVVSFMGLPPC